MAWPLVVLAASVLTVYGQEGTSTISGLLVNGTAGADVPQNVRVLLRVFIEDGHSELLTMDADAAGRFAFEEVPVNRVASYIVGATYLGVGYTEDLTPNDDLTNVRLTVYEATASLDNVSIAMDTLLVLGAEPATRTLSIMEIVHIDNSGDRVFLPDLAEAGSMGFLRFPLPPGFTNLDVQSELPEGQALPVDRGFGLIAPVPPGEHGVVFNYTVPYTGASLDISRSFLRGAGTFWVMVPQRVGTASSASMTDRGQTTFGESTYQLLESNGIPPAGSVDVILKDLPQPSLGQRIQTYFNAVSLTALLLPGALAMVLAALLIVGFRRARLPALLATGDVGWERASLVQAIAGLDDQFQRGELDETAYHEQRRTLKAHLLRLAQLEETTI